MYPTRFLTVIYNDSKFQIRIYIGGANTNRVKLSTLLLRKKLLKELFETKEELRIEKITTKDKQANKDAFTQKDIDNLQLIINARDHTINNLVKENNQYKLMSDKNNLMLN